MEDLQRRVVTQSELAGACFVFDDIPVVDEANFPANVAVDHLLYPQFQREKE